MEPPRVSIDEGIYSIRQGPDGAYAVCVNSEFLGEKAFEGIEYLVDRALQTESRMEFDLRGVAVTKAEWLAGFLNAAYRFYGQEYADRPTIERHAFDYTRRRVKMIIGPLKPRGLEGFEVFFDIDQRPAPDT